MSIWLLILLAVVLILARVPVAFSLIIPSLLYIAFDSGADLSIAVQQLMNGANSFALLAVPMFILLGNLANASGLTDKMFDFASTALRNVRGGLGYVNVTTSMGFSLVSGAAISDAAAMGKILVPQMVRRGYDKHFTLGLTASSSLIAPMVPPSIPAVIYSVTAGISVSAMFIAGVIPAAILACLLLGYVYIATRKMGLDGRDAGERIGFRGIAVLFLKVLPAFGAPVIVLGGILTGFFTPTEASAAGVVYMILLGLVFRSLKWPGFKDAIRNATVTSASIMFIVAGAGLFGWMLARERVPQMLAESVLSLTESPALFLLLLNILLLVVGAILEPTAAILIMVPVLAPMASMYGLDPVHMGVVTVFNLMIGLLTPPVGMVLFVLNGVTGYSVKDVIRGIVPFYAIMIIVLFCISYIPLLLL